MKKTTKPMLEDWLMVLVMVAEGMIPARGLNNVCQPAGPEEERDRFRSQLRRAEDRGWLQRERQIASLVERLTEHGRLAALGGRDPEARWNRNWDGRWRLVLFDLPTRPRHLRQRLLRWLHQNHFGYLQRSVWIHPDPLSELAPTLAEYRDDVESLTVLKAQTVAGYTNAALVQGAWDFDEINKRYTIYLDGFGRKRAAAIASGRGTFTWASRWLRAERVAWQHAVALDPLLPRALLPSGYRGTEAWQARRRVVRAVFNAFTRTQ